jgi:translation initiation factor IF-1
MPVNKKGGKKHKRFKKEAPGVNPKFITRPEGHLQFYATVTKPTGNRHFMVKLHQHDGQNLKPYNDSHSMFENEFRGGLRGNIRKGKWVSPGDLVLVSLRDFSMSDNNIDIIKKYEYEESKYLKRQYNIITNQDKDNNDNDVSFEYNDIDKQPTSTVKKNEGGSYINDAFIPSEEESEDDVEDNNNIDINNDNNYEFDVDEI